MKYFLYKLISPRPTFPADITIVEEKLMQEHIAYWKELAERKIAVIYGPVFDPKGAYGIAIVEVEGDALVHEIALKDPAIKGGGRFQI